MTVYDLLLGIITGSTTMLGFIAGMFAYHEYKSWQNNKEFEKIHYTGGVTTFDVTIDMGGNKE